jgi:hypothetical protein
MATINVSTVPSNTNVSVQDANNVQVNVAPAARINLEVTPVPTQVIQVNRGVAGPPGPNAIGGYPISVSSPSNYDALMFLDNEWTNVPQVEITDGGNF